MRVIVAGDRTPITYAMMADALKCSALDIDELVVAADCPLEDLALRWTRTNGLPCARFVRGPDPTPESVHEIRRDMIAYAEALVLLTPRRVAPVHALLSMAVQAQLAVYIHETALTTMPLLRVVPYAAAL